MAVVLLFCCTNMIAVTSWETFYTRIANLTCASRWRVLSRDKNFRWKIHCNENYSSGLSTCHLDAQLGLPICVFRYEFRAVRHKLQFLVNFLKNKLRKSQVTMGVMLMVGQVFCGLNVYTNMYPNNLKFLLKRKHLQGSANTIELCQMPIVPKANCAKGHLNCAKCHLNCAKCHSNFKLCQMPQRWCQMPQRWCQMPWHLAPSLCQMPPRGAKCHPTI